MHQAIDEWNSKVPNIKLQESTDDTKPADIDIKISSKAPQVTHATIPTIGGHAIAARKNIKLVQPGEAVISFDASGLITSMLYSEKLATGKRLCSSNYGRKTVSE